HVLMLRKPEPLVAHSIGMLRHLHRIPQRIQSRTPLRNRTQIQNRKRNHSSPSQESLPKLVRCSTRVPVTAERLRELLYTECLHGVFCCAHARCNGPPNCGRRCFSVLPKTRKSAWI